MHPASNLLQTAPDPALPASLPGMAQALDVSDCAIVITDEQRRIVYVNAGFQRLFGYTLQEAHGRRPRDLLLNMPSVKDSLSHIEELLASQGRFTGEALAFHRNGDPIWVSLAINIHPAPLPAPGESRAPGCAVLTFTDLTLTKLHEALQSRVLEAMVHEVPLPQLMTLVCQEVERMAPDVIASVLRVDANGQLHALSAPSLPHALSMLIDGKAIGPQAGSCGTAAYRGEPVVVTDIASDPLWQDYHPRFTAMGIRACWSSPIKNREGRVVGTFAFYFREPVGPNSLHRRLVEVCLQLCTLAMERETAQNRIHQLAYYDTLTHLPNRTLFTDCAQRALLTLGQTTQPQAALLFVDLDRFKLVNDSQGHAAGDALLCEIASRLRQQLRPQDLVGRLSSDEFVLMLPGETATQAIATAQRLLDSIAQPFDHQGMQHRPQACIGIALYPADGSNIRTLLRHADQAMQAAKKQPNAHWCRFSPELSVQAHERVVMEHDLREAIAQRHLHLHYQPQVLSQAVGRLHGVEALARWNHPVWGAVSPARFIALAEDSSLIQDLTRWLLEAACAQMARWRKARLPVPQLAINLSARNFHDPQLAEQVQAALTRHGLQPHDLVLEITESVMMDASAAAVANLHKLNVMGLQLSLDDFGTGYSSLSHLHRLPISELKLDQSFVRDLESSPAATALIRSVLSIARSLGMKVVAEGVETREQSEWLQRHGCAVMQGYLFCRPVSAAQLEYWLRAQSAKTTGA
ncbi:EAL domain-containing protein [Acidovorax sp. Be4]|uniref:EAL domain-containing protein n=1 Tax=Acidovorax bellezanensis TaxID=2976702 RepID=A0ABT2PFM7_9BURK|nr:EAL domain-containing protein [Acidovorax sp. Be4]MCT9809169.1 EAL domain-containing protein [Acidovorax sp. Be4]